MVSKNSNDYQIIYGKDFLRDLKKIIKKGDQTIKERVKEIIRELKKEPHKKRSKVDIKLISSREEGIYRVRIGK